MKYLTIFSMLVVLAFSVFVIAIPVFVPAEVTKPKEAIQIVIPEHAIQIADNVFSLGISIDKGRIVEGFLFVDKKENAKPEGVGSGKKSDSCYAYFAKGARWKTTENYITDGVDLVLTEASLNVWDSQVGFDIFGSRDTNANVDGADSSNPDGKNEVLFEDLGSTSTIAYAIVWGIFLGPVGGRELVEWDVVFNLAYPWSLTGEADKMDFMNIAVHEFGHSAGMAHPSNTCIEESMYAYADFGETKKRDLNAGDIAGIIGLYG